MKKYNVQLLTLVLLAISTINGYGQSLYLRTNSKKVGENYDYIFEQYKYTNFINDQYITSIFRFTPDGKFIINDSPESHSSMSGEYNEIRPYTATLDVASPSPKSQAAAVPIAIFGSFNGSGYTEHIRFNWDGKIGIGNSAPSAPLEIGKNTISTGSETTDPVFLKVHGSAIFDNNADNALTQVSINTEYKLEHSALTVGGPTFIGSWDETKIIANAPTVKADYLAKYNLWVTKGVVSEDFAITGKDSWKDEAFKEGYRLPTLSEVETFVKQNKHLPGVPSEKEVQEKGYTVHQMNNAFLEKIEHLVLYSIDQEKKLKEQTISISKLEKTFQEQATQMETLKAKLETLQTKIESLK